jgi:hypothetical protein
MVMGRSRCVGRCGPGRRWCLARLSVALAAAGVSLSAAASAAGLPGVLTPGAAHRFSVRPAEIDYTGDGSGVVGGFDGTGRYPDYGHLDWYLWSASKALAYGAAWIDNCTPSCASGTFSPHAVTVRASDPASGHFTRLTLYYRYHHWDVTDVRGVVKSAAGYQYDIVSFKEVRSPSYYVYRVYHTCANGGCGLHERTGPGYAKYRSVGLLHDGNAVRISCQAPGQPVSGINGTSSDVWDKLVNGDWVADYYVDTPGTGGAFSPPIPRCRAPQRTDRVTRLPALTYTAQDGHAEMLVPWQGKHVTVLVEPGVSRDPTVMGELVGALDRAWSYYAQTTGRVPAVPGWDQQYTLNGRDLIAEVSSTLCGAACTYVGADGTEIQTKYSEYGYNETAQHDLFDQVPFYELGRSFWFWGDQLHFQKPPGASASWEDPVTTGFAVWMRFQSMAAAGVHGAPFNGQTPFATFYAQVARLTGRYEANPSLTFDGTLAEDKAPPSSSCGTGSCGGTDFWASLMMQLAARHGGNQFISRFWHAANGLPPAASTAAAVANWERAASTAACANLSTVFYRRWGLPRPDGSITPRPSASAVPEPTGRCGSG